MTEESQIEWTKPRQAPVLNELLSLPQQSQELDNYLQELKADATLARERSKLKKDLSAYSHYTAQLEIIDAVISFVDGQADGTVTRG